VPQSDLVSMQEDDVMLLLMHICVKRWHRYVEYFIYIYIYIKHLREIFLCFIYVYICKAEKCFSQVVLIFHELLGYNYHSFGHCPFFRLLLET
jgi:hypothetical protein